MKRKAIYLAVVTAVIVAIGFLSIKKVSAITYPIYDETFTISERDSSSLGFSCAYLLALNPSTTYFLTRLSSNSYNGSSIYLTYGYTGGGMAGVLYVDYTDGANSYNVDTIWLSSPLIIVSVIVQQNELYLIIDEVEASYLDVTPPEVELIEFSQAYILNLEDYAFVNDYYDNSLNVNLGLSSNPSKSLLQFYYIEVGDSMNTVYSAFRDCLNLKYLSTYVTYGYNYGYDYGYDLGKDEGFDDGYSGGYDVGYHDGELGENALSPMWTILSSIATGIGQILSLELGYGVKLGTLLFVPLFFAVVGFILWIWRH